MAQHIRVVPYSRTWPAEYTREAAAIRKILGKDLVAMHHIGSTAVPGLPAKPIIDMLPVVRDITRIEQYRVAFEALGYEWMGELGIPGRRYCRKGGDDRTHQVHIFEEANRHEIRRHLAVRDYLRTHPDKAQEYGALKERLAALYPEDIAAYCDGKDAFVQQLEQEALSWYATAHPAGSDESLHNPFA